MEPRLCTVYTQGEVMSQ